MSHSNLDPSRVRPQPISVCSIAMCVRPAITRGFCEAHYARHRYGRPMDAPIEPRRKRGSPPDPLPRLAAEQPGAVKTCVKCGQEKAVAEFFLAKTCRDGRAGSCKACGRPRRQMAQRGYLKRHPNLSRDAKGKRPPGLFTPRSPEAAARAVARKAAAAMLRLGLKSCFACGEVKDASLFVLGRATKVGRCNQCRRAYYALYYKANREKVRKDHAKHYALNAARYHARSAAWNNNNPEKLLTYSAKWKATNRIRYLNNAMLRERQKRFRKRLWQLAMLQHMLNTGAPQ